MKLKSKRKVSGQRESDMIEISGLPGEGVPDRSSNREYDSKRYDNQSDQFHNLSQALGNVSDEVFHIHLCSNGYTDLLDVAHQRSYSNATRLGLAEAVSLKARASISAAL
ncbi:MAG: hypothetical protein ACYTGL_11450 [Planctomycetota bacterium]